MNLRILHAFEWNGFNYSFNQQNQKKKLTMWNNNVYNKKEKHLSMLVYKNVVGGEGTISPSVVHPLEQLFDGCYRITSVS